MDKTLNPFIRISDDLVFDLLAVEANQVPFEVIAHSLAGLPRFLRHIKITYTVGQHLLAGCRYLLEKDMPLTAKAFLLHDSDEIVLGDIPGPVKHLFPEIKEYANRIRDVIYKSYGVKTNNAILRDVKFVDELMLYNEYLNFHPNTINKDRLDFTDKHFEAWPSKKVLEFEDSTYVERQLMSMYKKLFLKDK